MVTFEEKCHSVCKQTGYIVLNSIDGCRNRISNLEFCGASNFNSTVSFVKKPCLNIVF